MLSRPGGEVTFSILPDWTETRGQGDETACVAPTAAVTLAFSFFSFRAWVQELRSSEEGEK